jgi:peptidoglycan/xylan/chitin deacetylase (PgdA/CDA1 family)
LKLASLYYHSLRRSGLVALARRLRRGGVILCYHNVVPDVEAPRAPAGGLHMARATFERQLRWLSAHYTIVALDELVNRIARGGPLRGVAALTFDDGYAGVFDVAWPLLHSLGIPATVFVVAGAPDRAEEFWWDHPAVVETQSDGRRDFWLSALRGDRTAILAAVGAPALPAAIPDACRPAPWPAIACAAEQGFTIGAHSTTHRTLPRLDDRELAEEIGASRDTIQAKLDIAPTVFAYPYGVWDDRVRRAVRAAGYRAALTLDAGANTPASDPWSLRRTNVPAAIGDAAFEAWTAGFAPPTRRGA